MKLSSLSKTAPVALLLTLALVLALSAAPAAAQIPPPAEGKLFLIHQEVANPAKLAAYESTTKEVVAAATANKITRAPFHWSVYMADDLSYLYVIPIQNLAEIDGIPPAFAELAGKMGQEKFADLMRRGGDAMLEWNDFVVRERPDLSYHPAKPRLKEEEEAAYRYEIYYLRPGYESDAEEIARTWVKTLQRIGFPNGFTLFETVTGHHMPAYVVLVTGKSEPDLAEQQAALDKALGAEGEALRVRTMGVTRRFEVHNATLRPDLSYHPAAAVAAAH